MLKGYLDRVEFIHASGWCAIGWALESDQSDKSVVVEVICGDKTVGTAVAGQYREDLAENHIGTGHHGFVAELTTDVLNFDVGSVRLGLRQAASGEEICPESSHPVEAIVGRIEGYRNMFVYGWACDTTNDGSPLSIDILVDGRLSGRVIADQQRADLLSYFSSGRGFFWPMPDTFADGVSRTISARVTNRPIVLSGSPLQVTIEKWQMPFALQKQLRWLQATREQLRTSERNLFFERSENSSSEIVGTEDFLQDRVDLFAK